jgi:hypothetical protein
MKHLFLYLVLLVTFFCSSCFNYECKESTGNGALSFTFDIPYSVNPSKDTFKVGDTIWVESSFSNQMYNQQNGKTYTLNHFDFKLSANLYNMNLNPLSPTPYCVLLNDNGTLDNTRTNFNDDFPVSYNFANGIYKWRKGFIITHTGLFLFAFYKGIGNKSLQDLNPPQRITECNNEYVLLNIKCLVNTNSTVEA